MSLTPEKIAVLEEAAGMQAQVRVYSALLLDLLAAAKGRDRYKAALEQIEGPCSGDHKCATRGRLCDPCVARAALKGETP